MVKFYIIILSFLLGVVCAYKFDLSLYFYFFIILILFSSLVLLKNINIFLFIIFFSLGILRVDFENPINNADFLLSKNIEFKGKIVKEPDKRENNTHYVVKIYEYNTIVKITLNRFPELKYNQEIIFRGKLEKPEKFKNDNGIYFNYPLFLAKDDIAYVMFYPEIVSINDLNKNLKEYFYEYLINIKNKFENNLKQNLKNPQSALAAGILVGSKQALGAELLEDFRRAGLIHLVVLSGYNVTIIADAIRRLFIKLPIFLSKFFSIFFIICFAILSGANSTTIRASIMAIIAVVAFSTERQYQVNRALWSAAFLMVLINPKIIIADPGFQLSFLSTLGLLYLSPKINCFLKFIPEKFSLRENISTTLSTQITVLPLLIKMTGEISIIAILSNILVLPFMPMAMLISSLSAVNFLGPITKIISLCAYIILSYIIFITEFFSGLSFAVLKIVFNDFPV